MEVRLATPKDAEALHTLNEMFGNQNELHALRESIDTNDREIICIACDQSQAAGFCTGLIVKSMCYSGNRIDVEALFVKEEYRGRGVGTLLLQHLQKEAAVRSIYHLHVVTHSSNKRAQSLYAREGFMYTGELLFEKGFLPDTWGNDGS